MPANYVLLEKITVGAAGASSITFSGIPQTGYTDLVIKCSVRSDRASNLNSYMRLYPNGSSTSITLRALTSNGTSAGSQTESAAGAYVGEINASTSTSSTFSSVDIYLPNYTGSTYKSYSVDAVMENNATTAFASLVSDLWSNTSAITSIQLNDALGNFVANSTFYLYGVAKLGTTPVIVPYATGGDTIMTDGTYWYHTFISSGTFTPQKALSCDYLVVAGGGSGGQGDGGGGGAGGYQIVSQGVTTTNYSVTIGAGGSAPASFRGNSGSNSSFASLITSTGGGGGGANAGGFETGGNGGSGGGACGSGTGIAGGTGISGQGFAGGSTTSGAPYYGAAGGGGAGAVGGNGTSSGGANGGAGSNSASSWASATLTGVSGYYAGGGGGGMFGGGPIGAGGLGGGGNATVSGVVNTGGGGGGATNNTTNAGNGGSGIVIIRYPIAS